MTTFQILVVDHGPATRQILCATLRRAGHAVAAAESGEQALEVLGRGDVDVAFCDISMPGIDGIELAKRARTACLETTFIMMTACSSADTAFDAMRAGAFDYLIRPLRSEELMQRLAQIAEMRALRAENRALRQAVQRTGERVFESASPSMRNVERHRITLAELRPQITTMAVLRNGDVRVTGARTLREQVREFERRAIAQAIQRAGGDRRLASARLAIGLSSLYRKLADGSDETEGHAASGNEPPVLDSRAA